ncbi:MAG TPA: PIG-L family deacetylase [Gaiellaceae bacterium]|jgi:LmbE family N-acetylglucosaminyl deacetylase
MRVLAVGAHPDDLEILCAGTLVRYVREGHEVVMCHVGSGDKGSTTHTREEIAAVRLREARRAAALAGAEHRTLGLPDTEVSAADPAQRRALVELLRQVRPDVVVTHHPDDYMGDHRQVSALVFDTTMTATLPLLETESRHLERIPPLFYMDTLAGIGFAPQEYVDVTAAIEVKLEMLAAHESQCAFLSDGGARSILDEVRTVARFRGIQAGVEYAEGFVQAHAWHRGTTRRLLPA